MSDLHEMQEEVRRGMRGISESGTALAAQLRRSIAEDEARERRQDRNTKIAAALVVVIAVLLWIFA